MSQDRKNIYIVWHAFQRRAESLSDLLDLKIEYFHFGWEEKGKLFKVVSYIPKVYLTMRCLFLYKPRYVVIQVAPTILLYVAAVYSIVTGNRYIADCHNTMIYGDHWVKWPLAKTLLRRSFLTLVHNEDVRKQADLLQIESQILRDPLPVMIVQDNIQEVAGISLSNSKYVIIPCGMGADEPVEELIAATRILSDTIFVMTWFKEKLPANLRSQAPDNMRFTGFLGEREFNALYSNASAALVLSTREGTQPSGAAEAISLGVPLVISRLRTTMRLYGDAPVFVDNEAVSIADGIRKAVENREALAKAVSDLKTDLVKEVNSEIRALKKVMI